MLDSVVNVDVKTPKMKENVIEELKEKLLNGQILLFDKPYKWTSFDVVNKVKWHLKQALGLKKIKIGHAGTLDPLATGLLVVCTGRHTKTIEQIQNQPKEYIATITLGKTTPSFDLETEVNQTWSTEDITEERVLMALKKLTGTILQEPPLFSAKWVDGKRAYELARKGNDKKLEPVEVTIYKNELLYYSPEEIEVKIVCSKGTYIRALARDIGLLLNNGGYLSELRRTAIGDFTVENAVNAEEYCREMKALIDKTE
jgi:tRNA pseudouridine55 synthase